MAKKLALSLSMFALYVVLILGGTISEEVFGTYDNQSQNNYKVSSSNYYEDETTKVLEEKIELSETNGERVVLILLEDKEYSDIKENEKIEEIYEKSIEKMQANTNKEMRMYLLQGVLHQIQ